MDAAMIWPFLGVALCAHAAGMLGSAAYALYAYSVVPKSPGGETKFFFIVLMVQLVKRLQPAKIAIALLSAALGLYLADTTAGAIGIASAICFVVAGLFLSLVLHRGGNDN